MRSLVRILWIVYDNTSEITRLIAEGSADGQTVIYYSETWTHIIEG